MKRGEGNPLGSNSMFVRWSVLHSILLLSATFYSLDKEVLWPLVFVGSGSFSVLLLSTHRHFGEQRIFHSANLVTALRLAGILTLAFIGKSANNFIITGIGLPLMVADSLDGWLARRKNKESEFGEYFDKETDAFFMLVLCLLAAVKGLLNSWILAVGILRYVFILVLFFLKPEIGKEERSNRARLISTVTMIILLFIFLPFELIRKPLAVMAVLLLLFSFARDFQKILQKNKYSE